LTDGKEHAGDDAADDADDTTSEPVGQRTHDRTCNMSVGLDMHRRPTHVCVLP